MDWMDFFKPNKIKLKNTLIFSAIPITICLLSFVVLPYAAFDSLFTLFAGYIVIISYNFAEKFYLSFSLLVAVSYLSACYLYYCKQRNKRFSIPRSLVAFSIITIVLTLLLFIGINVNTVQDCDKYPNVKEFPYRDYCYLWITNKQPDISICKKIWWPDPKKWCYTSIAREKNDESICGYMQGEGRDSCISEIAEKKEDPALCDTVSDVDIKYECYKVIGVENLNTPLCSNLINNKSRDDCYYQVGVAKQDISICNMIPDDEVSYDLNNDMKFQCNLKIAITKRDQSICHNMASSQGREACYYGMAIAVKDPLICDKIFSDSELEYSKLYNPLVEKCKEAVSGTTRTNTE